MTENSLTLWGVFCLIWDAIVRAAAGPRVGLVADEAEIERPFSAPARLKGLLGLIVARVSLWVEDIKT